MLRRRKHGTRNPLPAPRFPAAWAISLLLETSLVSTRAPSQYRERWFGPCCDVTMIFEESHDFVLDPLNSAQFREMAR